LNDEKKPFGTGSRRLTFFQRSIRAFASPVEQCSDHCANRREMNAALHVRPYSHNPRGNIFVAINPGPRRTTNKEIDRWVQSRSPKKSTSRAGVFLVLQL